MIGSIVHIFENARSYCILYITQPTVYCLTIRHNLQRARVLNPSMFIAHEQTRLLKIRNTTHVLYFVQCKKTHKNKAL